MSLITKIHQKIFNEPPKLELKELTSIENQNEFVHMLEKMDIA